MVHGNSTVCGLAYLYILWYVWPRYCYHAFLMINSERRLLLQFFASIHLSYCPGTWQFNTRCAHFYTEYRGRTWDPVWTSLLALSLKPNSYLVAHRRHAAEIADLIYDKLPTRRFTTRWELLKSAMFRRNCIRTNQALWPIKTSRNALLRIITSAIILCFNY